MKITRSDELFFGLNLQVCLSEMFNPFYTGYILGSINQISLKNEIIS
jgi:hypothetical protein